MLPRRTLVFVVGSVAFRGRVLLPEGMSEVRMSLCRRRKRAVFLRAGRGVVGFVVLLKVDSQGCVGGRCRVVR